MSVIDTEIFFPAEIFNFDAVPPRYLSAGIGPINLLRQARESALSTALQNVTGLTTQLSATTATGVYLDALGIEYGLLRGFQETDASFRARILSVPNDKSLTIPAIQAAVQLFFNKLNAEGVTAPAIVRVWDRQSDPASGVQFGLVAFQFVVEISFGFNRAFIAGRSYAGRTYTIDTSLELAFNDISQYSWANDLMALVTSKKAACTVPLYRILRHIMA